MAIPPHLKVGRDCLSKLFEDILSPNAFFEFPGLIHYYLPLQPVDSIPILFSDFKHLPALFWPLLKAAPFLSTSL